MEPTPSSDKSQASSPKPHGFTVYGDDDHHARPDPPTSVPESKSTGASRNGDVGENTSVIRTADDTDATLPGYRRKPSARPASSLAAVAAEGKEQKHEGVPEVEARGAVTTEDALSRALSARRPTGWGANDAATEGEQLEGGRGGAGCGASSGLAAGRVAEYTGPDASGFSGQEESKRKFCNRLKKELILMLKKNGGGCAMSEVAGLYKHTFNRTFNLKGLKVSWE